MTSKSPSKVLNKNIGLFYSTRPFEQDITADLNEPDLLGNASRVGLRSLVMGVPSPAIPTVPGPPSVHSTFDEELQWSDPVRDRRHVMVTGAGLSYAAVIGAFQDLGYSIELQSGNKETLLDALRTHGQEATAERIRQFFDLRAEEPDEPPIVIESLRSLVAFVIRTPDLVTPIIGSDPDGLMELEWHLRDNGDPSSFWGRGNGVVSMRFLRLGLIQYVALSGPYSEESERLQAQGVSTRTGMMTSLGEFAPRITTPSRKRDEAFKELAGESMMGYFGMYEPRFISP